MSFCSHSPTASGRDLSVASPPVVWKYGTNGLTESKVNGILPAC